MAAPVRIGVDLGTSHTVAVVRLDDGTTAPLLFDGSPLLPSAVYAADDGTLRTGRDALHSARVNPERFEPNPKRRVDDGTILLGDAEPSIRDTFSAVLARVHRECSRVHGSVPAATLTHPATWGPARRHVLLDAAVAAGFTAPTMLAEPVAAAMYFASRHTVPEGSTVVVFDFGGGTLDVSTVRRTGGEFAVAAVDGAEDLGGVDIDHGLGAHLRHQIGDSPEWARLLAPESPDDRRANRLYLDDVRSAKEQLSRHTRTELVVPLINVESHLTRDELEALTAPLLDRAVRITAAVIRESACSPQETAGLFLVGGASRMPLVATVLHRATGLTPTVIDQPELVVAQGATLTVDATSIVPPTQRTTSPLLAPHPSPASTTPTSWSSPVLSGSPPTAPDARRPDGSPPHPMVPFPVGAAARPSSGPPTSADDREAPPRNGPPGRALPPWFTAASWIAAVQALFLLMFAIVMVGVDPEDDDFGVPGVIAAIEATGLITATILIANHRWRPWTLWAAVGVHGVLAATSIVTPFAADMERPAGALAAITAASFLILPQYLHARHLFHPRTMGHGPSAWQPWTLTTARVVIWAQVAVLAIGAAVTADVAASNGDQSLSEGDAESLTALLVAMLVMAIGSGVLAQATPSRPRPANGYGAIAAQYMLGGLGIGTVCGFGFDHENVTMAIAPPIVAAAPVIWALHSSSSWFAGTPTPPMTIGAGIARSVSAVQFSAAVIGLISAVNWFVFGELSDSTLDEYETAIPIFAVATAVLAVHAAVLSREPLPDAFRRIAVTMQYLTVALGAVLIGTTGLGDMSVFYVVAVIPAALIIPLTHQMRQNAPLPPYAHAMHP